MRHTGHRPKTTPRSSQVCTCPGLTQSGDQSTLERMQQTRSHALHEPIDGGAAETQLEHAVHDLKFSPDVVLQESDEAGDSVPGDLYLCHAGIVP